MSTDNSEFDNDVEETDDTEVEEKDGEGNDEEEDSEESKQSDEGDKKPEEDDDKPLTRKDLREILKSNQNNNNASRRVASKKSRDIPDKAPKYVDRLDRIEREQKAHALLERKRSFGHENSLSPEEVDHIFRVTNNRPTKESLKDPFISGGLQSVRAAKSVRANTPSSSTRSIGSTGKSWSDLTPEERSRPDNLAERRRAILDSKGR